MSNPMYFKTIIVNVWQAVLPILALWIYFYNIRKAKVVATGSNTFATLTFPLLFIALVVDCIVDMACSYDPNNLNGGVMVFIMVVMIVVSLFNILYVISYKNIFTQCALAQCYCGYEPVTPKKQEAFVKLYTNESVYHSLMDSDGYELASDRVKERAEALQILQKPDWFSIINVHVTMNVIWSAAATTLLITMNYVMRVWCLYDDNIQREADIAIYSAFGVATLILVAVYDFFMFRTYSYPVFLHYIPFFIFSLSGLVEYHGIVHLEEAITLAYMAISIAAFVIKIKAGVDYKERKFHKAD